MPVDEGLTLHQLAAVGCVRVAEGAGSAVVEERENVQKHRHDPGEDDENDGEHFWARDVALGEGGRGEESVDRDEPMRVQCSVQCTRL